VRCGRPLHDPPSPDYWSISDIFDRVTTTASMRDSVRDNAPEQRIGRPRRPWPRRSSSDVDSSSKPDKDVGVANIADVLTAIAQEGRGLRGWRPS
jgi:hypothetical protein